MNGKTGALLKLLAMLALTAITAYYTTVSTMNREIGEIRATETAHFAEVLRVLTEIKADMRELRIELRDAKNGRRVPR